MKKQRDYQDSQDSKRCSQWSSTSLDEKKNLFTTLSSNLQRYERIFKHHRNQNFNQPRINNSVNSRRIVLPSLPFPQNKENSHPHSNYLDIHLKQSLKSSRKEVQKVRPYPKSLNQNHLQGQQVLIVKQREVKFERRNKKKYKDRFVDIYVGMKQSKGKQQISLKKIDSINKQNKEEKIDLFLKLLKR